LTYVDYFNRVNIVFTGLASPRPFPLERAEKAFKVLSFGEDLGEATIALADLILF
jgi:hypothetical protein